MSTGLQVGDIVWFWHEHFAEPKQGLVIQVGSRVSSLLFEGDALNISNRGAFHCLEDCIKQSLRYDLNRWR